MTPEDHLSNAGFTEIGKETPGSGFITAASLAGREVEPRQWHVEDLVPMETVTMLGGDGGTGKSLVALQLAVATATDRLWLGLPCRDGRALLLSAEDDMAELHRRLSKIAHQESVALKNLERLTLRSLAGQDALLATLDRSDNTLRPTKLFHELEERLTDEKPALLILDTLADLHSGDENSRAHARQFIGLLRGLAIRHSCAVLLLAHPSLTGMSTGSGLSGSTAWNGSVRSRLYLERIKEEGYEPNPDARRLISKKSNYGPTGVEIVLTWQDGTFVPQEPVNSLDANAASMRASRVFLELLRLYGEEGRHVSYSPGGSYAPARFAEDPRAEGITKRAFKEAMGELFAQGKIRNVESGPPSKRRKHLEVAGK